MRKTAEANSIANGRVHWEQFAATEQAGDAFTVVLAKSDGTIEVAANETILKAIERDNVVKVDSLCREGACGTCETRILEAEAVHLDQYLSDDEKAAHRTLMICVSRAKGRTLVLDL